MHGHGAPNHNRALDQELVLGILGGQDPAEIVRFSDVAAGSPVEQRLDRASLEYEAGMHRRQEAWLRARGYH